MKTKKLFLALMLPAAFAACSSEDVINDIKDYNAPTLKGDVVLTAVKEADAETRGLYEWDGVEEAFLYKWDLKTSAEKALGVCWTGKVGETVYVDQASKNLYTNYEFNISSGANKLKNGKVDTTDPSYKTAGQGGETLVSYANFTTTASSLFAGEYVVYYPYYAGFNEVGKIVATVKNTFRSSLAAAATRNDRIKEASKELFSMSPRTSMEGGQQTSLFRLAPKSNLLDLQITKANTAGTLVIDRVVIYDETGLASAVEYDADGNKGTVTYGHKTISAGLTNAVTLDPTTAVNIIIPMLNVDLKATTKIYLHATTGSESSAVGKWALMPFKSAYAMGNPGITPLPITELKEDMFVHDLVTSAAELQTAIESNTTNIDILTDIVLTSTQTGSYSSWNGTRDVTVTSNTGAKLIFDVKSGIINFGGTNKINLNCDVEVKDSGRTPSGNSFTLACGSNIGGEFVNKTRSTFGVAVTIAEGGAVVNNGTLTVNGVTVLGNVNNNGVLTINASTGFAVSGRNAHITNSENGKINNDGSMVITKYNTNSVVNNGVAVVGLTGSFEGDFDVESTGSFWKEVNTKFDFENALSKSYTRVVIKANLNYDVNRNNVLVLDAGSKDIQFTENITWPTAATAAGKTKDMTIKTSGTVIFDNDDYTIGNPETSPLATYPNSVVKIEAGAVEVNGVTAPTTLTVKATGVLMVTGDIEAEGADDTNKAEVTFEKGSTVSFTNYRNVKNASLNLKAGANVTYTGQIKL